MLKPVVATTSVAIPIPSIEGRNVLDVEATEEMTGLVAIPIPSIEGRNK